MLVKDVMNPDVKTAGPEISVQEAAEEMRKYRIGSLVIVKKTKLAGILTERDIMDGVVAEGKMPGEVKASEVMTTNLVLISPDKGVEEAAEIMTEKKIKKLPVVEGHQLVGIVTATDICAAEPKMMETIGTLMTVTKKKVVAG